MRETIYSFSLIVTLAIAYPLAGFAAQPEGKSAISPQSQLQQKPQDESKIHPEVRRKAQEDGLVRVLVALNIPDEPNWDPKSPARKAQRAKITNAQNALLKELVGKKYKILRKFEDTPGIGLEIDASAIPILENSSLVKVVHVSKVRRYSLAQAVPKIWSPTPWAGFDGTGQVVAIIDTGVSRANSFLNDPVTGQSKLLAEFCYSITSDCPNGTVYMEGDFSATPCVYAPIQCQHGTQMAGAAAGNAGVAKGAKIIAIRNYHQVSGPTYCPPQEDPCPGADDQDTIAGLEKVLTLTTTHSIAAVLLAFGWDNYTDQAKCDSELPQNMKNHIINLRAAGVATVAASGNNPPGPYVDGMYAPGCFSQAVSVGASTNNDTILNRSKSASFLSLLAPGDGIYTPDPNSGLPATGTSISAALVTGTWAILKQNKPTATVGQILNALQTTGVKITDTRTGANNRVNCRIQIDQALSNIPDAVTTLSIPGDSVAYGINNCGRIAGTRYDSWSGFLADTSESIISIAYDGAVEQPWGFYDLTEATAVNNKDEVHGYYCCGNYGDLGITRTAAGIVSQVTTPRTNDIYGTNDLGDMVGTYWLANPPWSARNFRYVNGTNYETSDYAATDINNMRRIVGVGGAGGYSGIITNEQGIVETEFDPPGSKWTVPGGINESGTVVGCYRDSSFNWNAFKRDPAGAITTISIPGATRSCAYGINDSGQIVGYYEDSGGTWNSFVDLRW